jgi:hypothetical protein
MNRINSCAAFFSDMQIPGCENDREGGDKNSCWIETSGIKEVECPKLLRSSRAWLVQLWSKLEFRLPRLDKLILTYDCNFGPSLHNGTGEPSVPGHAPTKVNLLCLGYALLYAQYVFV